MLRLPMLGLQDTAAPGRSRPRTGVDARDCPVPAPAPCDEVSPLTGGTAAFEMYFSTRYGGRMPHRERLHSATMAALQSTRTTTVSSGHAKCD